METDRNGAAQSADKKARTQWEAMRTAGKDEKDQKAKEQLTKPDFFAVPEGASVKAQMAADADFKEAVTKWDNRRKVAEQSPENAPLLSPLHPTPFRPSESLYATAERLTRSPSLFCGLHSPVAVVLASVSRRD